MWRPAASVLGMMIGVLGLSALTLVAPARRGANGQESGPGRGGDPLPRRLEAPREAIRRLMPELLARVEEDERHKDALRDQQIAVQQAEAQAENARLLREIAELGVTSYEKGEYDQAHKVAILEVDAATAELNFAVERLALSDKLLQQGRITKGQNAADRKRLERARLELDAAKARRDLLEKFERPKRLALLQSEVEKAKADELAAQATVQFKRDKEKSLRRRLEQNRPSPEEAGALAALDEAITLLDRAKDDPGQAEALNDAIRSKVDEAERLWRVVTGRSEAQKEAEQKRQIHAAAAKWRESARRPAASP